MNFEKFKKLMALTTSDNDGEALNAIRQANKIIQEAKLTWDEVFSMPDAKLKEAFDQLVVQYNIVAQNYNSLRAQLSVTWRIQPQKPAARRHRRF